MGCLQSSEGAKGTTKPTVTNGSSAQKRVDPRLPFENITDNYSTWKTHGKRSPGNWKTLQKTIWSGRHTGFPFPCQDTFRGSLVHRICTNSGGVQASLSCIHGYLRLECWLFFGGGGAWVHNTTAINGSPSWLYPNPPVIGFKFLVTGLAWCAVYFQVLHQASRSQTLAWRSCFFWRRPGNAQKCSFWGHRSGHFRCVWRSHGETRWRNHNCHSHLPERGKGSRQNQQLWSCLLSSETSLLENQNLLSEQTTKCLLKKSSIEHVYFVFAFVKMADDLEFIVSGHEDVLHGIGSRRSGGPIHRDNREKFWSALFVRLWPDDWRLSERNKHNLTWSFTRLFVRLLSTTLHMSMLASNIRHPHFFGILISGTSMSAEKSPPLWGRDNEGGKASDWSRIQNPAFWLVQRPSAP